jgi:hypothetical protein
MPDEAGRQAILRVLLSQENVAADVDYRAIAAATPNYSGSDLKVQCFVVVERLVLVPSDWVLFLQALCRSAVMLSVREALTASGAGHIRVPPAIRPLTTQDIMTVLPSSRPSNAEAEAYRGSEYGATFGGRPVPPPPPTMNIIGNLTLQLPIAPVVAPSASHFTVDTSLG